MKANNKAKEVAEDEADDEALWRDQVVNSIELFWLEKSLEFWFEIPYSKKTFKNG